MRSADMHCFHECWLTANNERITLSRAPHRDFVSPPRKLKCRLLPKRTLRSTCHVGAVNHERLGQEGLDTEEE